MGHWESLPLVRLNDEILEAASLEWDDPSTLPATWIRSPVAAELRDRLVKTLAAEYGDSPFIVVKDPRICRLLPLWIPALEELDFQSRFVLTVRNPLEVAASLKARDGFSTGKSLLLWLRYVIESETATRTHPRAFVAFDDLLADWRSVAERLSSELGVGWGRSGHRDLLEIDRFLAPGERHHKIDEAKLEGRADVVSWVRETNAELRAACASEQGAPRSEVIDRVASALNEADVLYGPLLAEVQLERESERSRLDERIEAHQEAMERRDTRITELEREIETQADEHAALAHEHEATLAGHAALQGELSEKRRAESKLGDELEALRGSIGEERERVTAVARELRETSAKLVSERASLQADRAGAAAVEASRESLERRLKSRTREVNTNRARIRQLREREAFSREVLEGVRRRELVHHMPARTKLRVAVVGGAKRSARMVSWIVRDPVRLRAVRNYLAIRWHGEFDPAFYLRQYPDVTKSGIDPLMHFVQFGLRENRDPNPYFSSREYLESHPELREIGESPLLHSIRHRNALKRARGTERPKALLASEPSVALQLPAPLPAAVAKPKGSRRRVVVLSWDMTHNPAGRAYLLADMLSREFDVTLAGPMFPRYGTEIWGPIRSTEIDTHGFTGQSFPGHLQVMERMARELECDAVVVSKPRLPSYGVAMMMKLDRGTPVILDVDDHELAFFPGGRRLELEALGERAKADGEDFQMPFGQTWTELCEGLIPDADAVTVSNSALRARYDGTIIPHARNEASFDPASFDRDAVRSRYGITPDDRVVLFLGTPRLHKGLFEILDALEAIGDPRLKLCLIGTITEPPLRERLMQSPRTVLIPNRPFSELPENMLVGDAICLLQDPEHPIARYQMPAKFTDALAMGVPILARVTPPLQEAADRGLLIPVDSVDFAERLEETLTSPSRDPDRARKAREEFLETYSYRSVSPRLVSVVNGAIDDPKPPSSRQAETVAALRQRFGSARKAPSPAAKGNGATASRTAVSRQGPKDSLDLVCFWKQNDSGIYGRRQDMLVKYLARSEQVRKVVHFDAPMPLTRLLRHRAAATRSYPTHDGLIYKNTMRRAMRTKHGNGNGNVRSYTYVYRDEDAPAPFRFIRERQEYLPYVQEILDAQQFGQEGRKVVLIGWPTLPELPRLIDDISTDLAVADIVDDNRTWLRAGTPSYLAAERNYRDTLGKADLVLANCRPVAEAMAQFRKEVHILPNASEHPLELPLRDKAPRELRGMRGPIVGYSGNLSARIDISLLELVAMSRPNWNLVFIGSAHLDQSVMALDRFDNVHFLGVKPYPDVADYVRYFDVAMIPHTIDSMTATMHPLKAILYTSLEVPVVATEVANLDSQSGITMASQPPAFVRAIDEALARQANAPTSQNGGPPRLHTWEERVESLLGLVEQRL
ncbi:MAG: glycosyltransferase [Actinomycetota bacterium]|nr:glycosyltransferase [Actinomycetota bacterium]